MSTEQTNATTDIKWFHGEIKRRGLPAAKDGMGSAFAERVAIKLEGSDHPDRITIARYEALREIVG